MNTAEKYIRIEEIEPAAKTKRWRVFNIRSAETCGIIKWYGGFRKYVFFPNDGFLFDHECLQMIADFLRQQNAQRKKRHD